MDSVDLAEKKPRARKSNFSPQEIAILIDEGVENNKVLSAAFGPGVTKKTKDNLWESIATKINANTAGGRSASEVRKKWNDIKCQAKKRAQEKKKESGKTGGGPSAATSLNDLDEKVLSTIPTCQVEGIDGGMEIPISIETSVRTETPISTEGEPPASHLLDDTDIASLPTESAAAPGLHMEVESSSTSTSASSSTSASASASASVSASPMSSSTVIKMPKPMKLVKKSATRSSAKATASPSPVGSLLKVEGLKLETLQEILSVERERLAVEKERLAVERERLSFERQRFELKQTAFNSSVESFLTPVISFD